MQHQYYAGYFQDDYKLTNKLTLNLGVRYEYFNQLRENNGQSIELHLQRQEWAFDVFVDGETLQYAIFRGLQGGCGDG